METTDRKDINIIDGGSDLEQMRSQLGILKRKLDRQAIVTDRLLHDAMRGRMAWIDKYLWFAALVLFPVVCVAWWQVKGLLGLSWLSYLLVVALTGGCVAADIVVNRMRPADWEACNLVQTGRKLARMKRVRSVQVRVQVVLLVAVMAEVAADAASAGAVAAADMRYMGGGMLVGLLVGGGIGLVVLARMQRTNDGLIRQIDELTAGGR